MTLFDCTLDTRFLSSADLAGSPTARFVRMIACLIMLAFCLPAPAGAQDQAEDEFRAAVALYDAGQYRPAADAFSRILQAYPAGKRSTAAIIMRAKALYWLDDNLECARLLKSFIAEYPTSSYQADAHATLGQVYRRVGRMPDAVQEYIAAWEILPVPAPPVLASFLPGVLDTVLDRSVPTEVVRGLRSSARREDVREFLWVKTAEVEIAQGNTLGARATMDTIGMLYPASRYRERLVALRGRVLGRTDVRIGLLLPILKNEEPSAMKEIGTDVYEGMQFAIEKFQREPGSGVRITVLTRDTQRDVVFAESGARELAADSGVVAILGPVFSATTSAAARALRNTGVPMISPTANASGIAAIGPRIFQANPDYDMRGRAMARYAVIGRGLKKLAIVAPNNSQGKYLAEGFIKEARNLGARVVGTEWYERGSSDLSGQFRSLRRVAFREGGEKYIAFGGKRKRGELMRLVDLGIPLRRIDSLMNKGGLVNAVQLLGPAGAARLDSLGIQTVVNETRVDSVEYPVEGIDGIYIPISSPEEIGIVSSQAVYFNFRAQILGSGEWNSIPELDANRRYCQGVIFESDSWIDSSAAYVNFVRDFSARYRRPPSKNNLYGFDTAELVLGLLRSGALTRDQMAAALSRSTLVQGFHGKMGFSTSRVNPWVPIVQFDGENIRLVEEIRVE